MKFVRILYLADIRFPLERANGIQTMETCHALARRGHDVWLAVRPDTSPEPRDPFLFYGLDPVESLRIERRGASSGPMAARRARYLAGALRRSLTRSVDVVLTRDLGVADAILRVPRVSRPPVVYESHGYAPAVREALPSLLNGVSPGGRLQRRRLMARERRVWRRADGIVTITNGLAHELGERFGGRPSVSVIPDGVRVGAGRVFDEGRKTGRPVVGYAGHLYPWKGVDVLIEAIASLPDVDGLVIGGHPREPDLGRLRDRAAELGIEARIRFAGALAPGDVAPALAGADVLVLPNPATAISVRYTSPLKLFEYMAAGRPIVASDLPSIREVLSDGENALLVAPGRPDALAAGIRRAIDDRALAGRIARRAFDQAPGYSWERRAERLERALEQARRR